MLFGLISDIHSNYSAAKAVFSYLKKEKTDRIINCGDIVGYGPQPDECVNLVRNTKRLTSVLGNHDYAVSGLGERDRFNRAASNAIKWTREQMSAENLNFLKKLAIKRYSDSFVFIHGSLRRPLFEYIFDLSVAALNFSKMDRPLCFVGHTHVPACFKKDSDGKLERVKLISGKKIFLDKHSRYIVNVGSVGQPRDGNPDAAFCLYDSCEYSVTLYRIKYDIKDTSEKIISSGLPEYLALRLYTGE